MQNHNGHNEGDDDQDRLQRLQRKLRRENSQGSNVSGLSSDEDDDEQRDTFSDTSSIERDLQQLHRNLKLPPPRSMGGRSQSTAIRLHNQGLRTLSIPGGDNNRRTSFVLQSIHHGTDEWMSLISPFVSDLAFRSIASRRYTHEEIQFRPYSCQAALLFVDLSGYSKVTSVLQHKGAHVLSSVVNAYLSRLLKIIRENGGDVLKFAGDAILVSWEGKEGEAQEFEVNVWLAAKTAMELQTQAGTHEVEGTGLTFRIHCAISGGPLDSEVFEAPIHQHMQRLYHFVGGDAVEEIGDLVDLAKAGEICVSRNCYTFLDDAGTFDDLRHPSGAKLLRSLNLEDPQIVELMSWHLDEMNFARQKRRDRNIEEDFIHPTVLAFLHHGGLSPTQIAQMRNLCVLFMAMTSRGSSVNWLMEVQAVLDRNRCPIVQIIHDDKGVHIVAAVNLYEAVPEASLVGLEVCRELAAKRVGTAVGVAMGPTFCGVTGSTDACRWDITGAPVVRAARLMQYALDKKTEFAIDQSLYNDSMAATRMQVLDAAVSLKGTNDPIAVYTLSDAKLFSAFRILENVHGAVHNAKVQEIQNHISSRHRSAVLVTGIPLAGMMIVCQRAAGYSDLVPYMHLGEESAGFLQLARTIATWFQYSEDETIQKLSKSVMEDIAASCWSSAHDVCVKLVHVALSKGCQACFVVHRMEELDKFSLSLIRECLQEPQTMDIYENHGACSSGQLVFLCTHLPLYNSKNASDLVQDITRSHTSFKIPIVELGEASKEELRNMVRDLSDIEVENRWLDANAEASGYSAEYFLERTQAVQNMSAELWREGRPALVETSESLVLHIPPGLLRKNKDLRVTEIRAELAMRFSQIFDDIPPICQMVVKTVTIATRRGFYKLPHEILWETMNDIISSGVDRDELDIMVEDLVEIGVLKIEDRDERTVGTDMNGLDDDPKVYSIQCPALADIAMDVCTPVQVRSIAKALIDRLGPHRNKKFQVALVVAGLKILNEVSPKDVSAIWRDAYEGFKHVSRDWSSHRVDKWKEIFDDEIRGSGCESMDVLGSEFSVPVQPRTLLPPCITMLKTYTAPVALGPMGQSFSVICRNTFQEFGVFHGAYAERAESQMLQNATGSACGRYMMQMSVVEDLLREHGFGISQGQIESEMEIISGLARPAESADSVNTKAFLILEEIVPNAIERRLQRLYKLVNKFKQSGETPSVFDSCRSDTLRRAYIALQAKKSRMDAAQDALMILATTNWKAPSIPEYLPLMYQQTVANVRNATLKRLSAVEVVLYRHQQNVDDLEAFLIVTPLLHQAMESGLC